MLVRPAVPARSKDERCALIARVVQQHRDEIVARWMAAVRADDTIPSARKLDDQDLQDHAPVLLDELVGALDGHDERQQRLDAAKHHGAQRASRGYQIREVMREMHLMRSILVELLESMPVDLTGEPGRALHRVLDESITASTEQMEAVTRAAIERERDDALRARMHADRVGEQKDLFVAVLAHEIRTPLNAMVGWTALARERAGADPLLLRALDTIQRNVDLQRRLVEDLLDLERVRSGKLSLERAPVDLARIVDTATASSRPIAARKEITLTCVPSAPVIVEADADRLEQVVSNLLMNALKFTSSGGHVEVEIERGEDHARVRVRDDGVGISPDMHGALFERYRQADHRASAREGGIGIGLALVRELVHAHGGQVGAESAGLGAGSTFWFALPLLRTAREE